MAEQGSTGPCCFHCNAVLDVPAGPVGRSATCASCDSDIRVCLNCQFYDPNSYNECSEPMAERVVDKDRANFCDYFALGVQHSESANDRDAALKKLNELFK